MSLPCLRRPVPSFAAGIPCGLVPLVAWQFQPNDASPLGWLVTGGYLLAAGLGFHLARRSARSGPKEAVRCWLLLAAVLAALGINKELDVQTLLIEVAREVLRSCGWSDPHRAWQQGVTAIALVVVVGVAWWWGRANWRFFHLRPLVAAGTALVGLYVLLRVASINHLETGPLADGEGPMGSMMELCGTSLLICGMIREAVSRIPLPPV